MPTDAELVGRIVLAAALGAAIGLEREITDQSAGIRTHLSVALGAALFGLVSLYGFPEFGGEPRDESSYQVDVTRVASNVVTGVGFLGGGAILKYGASVRGLTTAASLWVTAAVGLAVAVGRYLLAGTTAALLLLALAGLRGPRRWVEQHLARRGHVIEVDLAPRGRVIDVRAALHDMAEVEVRTVELRHREGVRVLRADVRTHPSADLPALLDQLVQRDDVVSADVVE